MASRNRGKKKPKLRDLSRLPPTIEEHRALVDALQESAPPIVVAVIGQALIEHDLEQLLRRKFTRTDDNTWEMLTDDKGPLGTFFAKIVAGYAFRLYDEDFCTNLHIVRNIRNVFAHAKRVLSFDHELIQAELARVKADTKSRRVFHRNLRDIASTQFDSKAAYALLCLTLTNYLSGINVRYMRGRFARNAQRRRNALAKALLATSPGIFQGGLFGLRFPEGQDHDK